MKLLHITTVPATLRFLRGQVEFMRERGFDVHVASAPGQELDDFGSSEGVPVHPVPMSRSISPWADLRATGEIVRIARRLRPAILHSHTPKAGLLGMLAGRIASVPVRFYHMRGLPAATATGWRKSLLTRTEHASCSLADRVITVSPSLRMESVRLGLCPQGKITVMGAGSSNGVDAQSRFNPDRLDEGTSKRIRRDCDIAPDAPVVGFVGRLAVDKGIGELLAAFTRVRERVDDAHLVVVGPRDTRDPLPDRLMDTIDHRHIHFLGWRDDLPEIYTALDVLALPSHREGFPNVALEAAAMGLPVVTTDAVGCRDAVLDGATGRIVPVGDVEALAAAITDYIRTPEEAAAHGRNGRARARAEFQSRRIWAGIHDAYVAELAAKGMAP